LNSVNVLLSQHFFEAFPAAPVEGVALAEAGDDGTCTVDDRGVLALQRWRIERRRCAEALGGGDEREPATHAESGDANRAGAVGPSRQQLPCRCDVLEGAALVGHEVVHNRSHAADHPAAGEQVGCDRQVTVVGDSTRDLAVGFA
jgi:hypothetical protein